MPAQYLAIGFKGTGRHRKGRFFAPLFDYAFGPSTSVDPKKLTSPRPSVNKSGAPNFFIEHDKVEDSKLRRYLETCGGALEHFLQLQTSSMTPLSSYSACCSTDW